MRATAAIVLAGGRARRLGQPKPSTVVGAATLLHRALVAVTEVDAVVVGPTELSQIVGVRRQAELTQESPPFGGPVAGIAAGWSLLREKQPPPEWLILLACDIPRAAEAVRQLLREVPDLGDAEPGVCLTIGGHPQWLCGIYRASAVATGLERLETDGGVGSAPVRALLGSLDLRVIPDTDGVALDVDTPDDLRAAIAVDAARSRGERSTA